MFHVIFELYYSIMDIIVIHFFFDTVFSKKKKITPIFYWVWLFLWDVFPLPISSYFFGTYSTLKNIVLASLSFLTIFLMSLLYESTLRHRLFISFFYIFLAGLCEDIPGMIFTILSNNYLHLEMKQIELIVQAQYSFFFFFLVSVIRIFYRKKARRFSLKYSVAILITPLLSLFIMGDTSQIVTLNTAYKISIIARAVCLFIINIINFVLLDNFFTIQNLEEEKLLLNQQVSYQTSKYNQISTAYRNTRSILHDTKKHFMYLQQCIKCNDTEHSIPYMERAMQEMEGTYNRINTGNLVIDCFLSSHLEIAEREGILYTTDINVNPNDIPVEDYDLSVVLGNLLDNTLEECRNIKPPANRSIYVQIFTTDTAFMLHIVNSSEERTDKKHRKDDMEYTLYHGYGLENVRTIIKKYYGSYDFRQQEQYFDVAIMIPIIQGRIPKRVGDAY